MYIFHQRFGHLVAPDICNSVESQAVADLVVLVQVFPNRVDYQSKQIGVLVHQQRHREVPLGYTNSDASVKCFVRQRDVISREWCTYYLLLTVFRTRNEVYGLHMSDVDFVTQDICEDDLGHISIS